jgi:hypothetical protein
MRTPRVSNLFTAAWSIVSHPFGLFLLSVLCFAVGFDWLPPLRKEVNQMQTDTICAFQLEENDFFVESGEQFQVIKLVGDDQFLDFIVREVATDDEYPMTFAPFDTVTLITSFEEWDDTLLGDAMQDPNYQM